MKNIQEIADKIKNYFAAILTANPHYFAIFIVFVGVVCLIAAITDANWLFGNVSGVTYNLRKIDGWVNLFGRKIARIISGVFSVIVILLGLIWFVLGELAARISN